MAHAKEIMEELAAHKVRDDAAFAVLAKNHEEMKAEIAKLNLNTAAIVELFTTAGSLKKWLITTAIVLAALATIATSGKTLLVWVAKVAMGR